MKLIIFDMDGVLVDACEWHRIALNEALQGLCNITISLEDHYREYNGLPTRVKLKKLLDKGLIQSHDIEKIEFEKQKRTIDAIEKNSVPRQEKIDLMNFLKKNNIKIACYTNSIRSTAEMMLSKTGIKDYFDLLVTNQDVKKPKPDPEGYTLCMSNLNISKVDCLIIEDSDNGYNAACLSGANVLRVRNPDEVNIKLIEERLK